MPYKQNVKHNLLSLTNTIKNSVCVYLCDYECVCVILSVCVALWSRCNENSEHTATHHVLVIRGSVGWASISLNKPSDSHAGSQTVIVAGGDR